MNHQEKDIKFLTRENKALKDEIQELRDVIKVNKQSIDILSNPRIGQSDRNKLNMTMDAASVSNGKNYEEARLLDVIKMLNNQNSDLMKQLESVKQLNEELNTKILLLQQITDASEIHEQQTIMQIESEMKSLNKTLIKTQDKLMENELGRGEFDSMSGFVIKYKEVHAFTQQAGRFMEAEELLIREIQMLKATIEEFKSSRDKLISLNINLKNEVIKLKATMLMPNRTFDPAGQASLKRLALYFLDAQRKVCEDSDYEDDLELVAPELMVLFPDKVNKVCGSKEKIKIPKLNLMRAYEMMFSNQGKIEADLKRRNNMSKTERLARLEEELDFTRRQLTRTMLQLKQSEQFKVTADRLVEELKGRNQLLTDSYEAMMKKMRNFKPKIRKSSAVDLNKTYNVSFMNCTFIDKNPTFTKENGPMERIEQQPKLTQESFNLTEKEQFEIQANNLAHEVAKLPFINKTDMNKVRPKAHKKQTLMRSYSNPLLYMQDRKEVIFNKKPKDPARVPEPRHHDETCFDRIDTKNFEENLDDIQL